MDDRDSIQSLLTLRKLTRAIAETVRGQMTEYLATLTPLLQPKSLLGDYIQGGQREPSKKADKAFKDLQGLYETVGGTRPFNLPRELASPISFASSNLEITPLEYPHEATAGADTRTIVVRTPLSWMLTYTGCSPARLRELLSAKARSNEEVQRYVLAYLMLHVVATSQPGLLQILEALHFPLTTMKVPEFGELPVTIIGASVATSRPSDAVIIESAELSGMNAFEEVVDVAAIAALKDPLRERLLDIARQQAPDLVPR
jgi:hypothetical protein